MTGLCAKAAAVAFFFIYVDYLSDHCYSLYIELIGEFSTFSFL